jgi:glycosyltransferase 2 family protein
MKKSPHTARTLALIASMVMFAYLLRRTSPATILGKARLLGFGFVILIVLSGVRQALRTIAWGHCVEPDGYRPGLLSLFGLRIVGEALSDVTPAGLLLGETTKVVVVSRRMSIQSGALSVVVENMIYALGAIFFMLSGVVLALLALTTGHTFRWLAGGLVICFVLLCCSVSGSLTAGSWCSERSSIA